MLNDIQVVVRGAGDLATGVIYTLHQAGFQIVATEIEEPLVVRRTVSFAEAVYQDRVTVEGITAVKVEGFSELEGVLADREVPILVDPEAEVIDYLQPEVVIDGIMAKRNIGTKIDNAELVIGLGPGFRAGEDVDAVIETNRGHDLGRIITEGEAEPNTDIPGEIKGYSSERVLKSPTTGRFITDREIGDRVKAKEVIGYVGEKAIKAKISGVIRGLLASGIGVEQGTKLGDIDPRERTDYCYRISDKARTIGGAVLAAVLSLNQTRNNILFRGS